MCHQSNKFTTNLNLWRYNPDSSSQAFNSCVSHLQDLKSRSEFSEVARMEFNSKFNEMVNCGADCESLIIRTSMMDLH